MRRAQPSMETPYPYHDVCFTIFSVLWLEFIVWGLTDKLSVVPKPKKEQSSFHRSLNVAPFFFRPVGMCVLFVSPPTMGLFGAFFLQILTSHGQILVVLELTGIFRFSLVTMVLITGWVFVILLFFCHSNAIFVFLQPFLLLLTI